MPQAILGIPVLLLAAWLTSSDRRRFPLKIVASGLLLQGALALLFLRLPPLQALLLQINRGVLAIEAATREGTTLVFGFLGGGPAPFEVTAPEHSFVLAFRALPLVLVFAPLCALLWHWRVIPAVVGVFSRLLEKAMGLSGAVSMGAASSIFIGMVESPLMIRPYLARMSNSELFILMTCGMATVAGTVMGLYAGILAASIPAAMSHILVASLISAPAAIVMAAIMLPPGQGDHSTRRFDLTEAGTTESGTTLAGTAGSGATSRMPSPYHGSVDAIVSGVGEGVKLLGSIVAMLIVFVALVELVNLSLGLVPTGGEPLTLSGLFGTLLRPLAWLLGVPWQETGTAGELLATKLFINELVAYLQLASLPADSLGEHSRLVLTYALCGFANFGSLGILLGGMTAMCPERREDIMRLAPRSIWSGFLATCLTGALVGLLYPG
jgi:CNT family concentrative nucleoside transporter